MKRLILLIGCTFILVQAKAQVQERTFFVTASGGATIHKENKSSKAKSLKLGGSINYQLNHSWSLGLTTEHTISTSESNQGAILSSGSGYSSYRSSSEAQFKSWFIGPQARYYYPLHNKISLFGEAQTGVYWESSESKSASASSGYLGGNFVSTNGSIAKDYSSFKAKAARAIVSQGLCTLSNRVSELN
ncbi:hypothetical protein [Pontibacter oryzae]|uniref:Outer membrane protein beta-barrel domain-containing protein n=1 Tax=Pontibacter oryzae TaxID=2304593 RepID=A0A399SLH5_9BACT|nr:hypothetical protein [Pontibacter oryzae]RIJ42807.1 hypothetical protein D1627_02870 [Pontibacter oryzae]